jgi:hypothetical protein
MQAIKKTWGKMIAREARAIIGFIVAPVIPGVLVALPDLLRGDPMARWYIEFSATAGYPVMLILGVPMYFLSKRWGWTGLPVYVAIGSILGAASYLSAFVPGLVMGAPGVGYAMTTTFIYLPISVICGVIAMISFWLIARPDRSRP